MDDAENIMWADRTLAGLDDFGRWVTTGLDGWWDSPDIKGENDSRANADGDHDLPVYNMARFITITGSLHTTSHDQLHDAGDYLTGPMGGRLQVGGHGDTRWADTKRIAGVKFTPITDKFAQWQVRLKAANPRKFGETQTIEVDSGATVSVSHRGNYNALPIFTVAGAMPGGYTLNVGGRSYIVQIALAAGIPHVIDYRDGRLRIAGAVVPQAASQSTLATIAPGINTAVTLTANTSGSGTATLDLLDTYI